MSSEQIAIRGNRKLWFDFITAVKKDGKTAWAVLKPFIKAYTDPKAKYYCIRNREAKRKI